MSMYETVGVAFRNTNPLKLRYLCKPRRGRQHYSKSRRLLPSTSNFRHAYAELTVIFVTFNFSLAENDLCSDSAMSM